MSLFIVHVIYNPHLGVVLYESEGFMEKSHSSLMGKIFMFIPRAASAVVTFKSPPISPRKPPIGGGLVIRRDARRRFKNDSFDSREPASPIVSCVGQVKKSKNRKKKKKKEEEADSMEMTARAPTKPPLDRPIALKKKEPHMHMTIILKLFKSKKLQGEKSHGYDDAGPNIGYNNENQVPPLGHLKQFSSSRSVLANFDSMSHNGTAVARDNVLEHGHQREERDNVLEHGHQREERLARVTQSGPIEVISCRGYGEDILLQPRKEVNLWKRRTGIRPPMTLRL
ncbi:hypothetical protein SAY87_018281 [Trapa incisa]|uniref:Uncharacterized protein n=1 Tax=Trapa incisa TaxID=236973 RepID=A0AAN7L5R9_9MYRT|nr:hypothetical protein SAY87_018281 [Trapa incisa]